MHVLQGEDEIFLADLEIFLFYCDISAICSALWQVFFPHNIQQGKQKHVKKSLQFFHAVLNMEFTTETDQGRFPTTNAMVRRESVSRFDPS